jgi:hypothetical protein
MALGGCLLMRVGMLVSETARRAQKLTFQATYTLQVEIKSKLAIVPALLDCSLSDLIQQNHMLERWVHTRSYLEQTVLSECAWTPVAA